MKKHMGLALVASLMFTMGVSSPSFAQEQPEQRPERGGERGDRGGERGDRGRFDPAAMRERMNAMMKERLGASDEEWKVIQPRIEKVQTLQRAQSGRGGFGGGFGRGGDRGGDNQSAQPQSPVAKASAELRQATENKDTPAAEVTAKLTAYREAKAKAKQELTAAQKELTEILTPRQEAILVNMGMLE